MEVKIYEKNGNKINIHLVEPNTKKIYEYKKKQMECLPKEKRVFMAYTTDETLKPLQSSKDYVDYEHLNWTGQINGKKEYHKITSEEGEYLKEAHRMYLDKYLNLTDYKKIYRVMNSKDTNLKYLMPLSPYIGCNYDIYYIENIINIPSSLFYLNEFQQENFLVVSKQELMKILELYDYKGNREYNEELENNTLDEKIEKSQRVLSLIK